MCETSKILIPAWPDGLEQNVSYTVLDQDEPSLEGKLNVLIDSQGDVFVSMSQKNRFCVRTELEKQLDPLPCVRICTRRGGGRHQRTRQALLWLAQAIKLDEEELNGEEV